MDATNIMERLQAPFPAEDIEWRVGSTTQDKSKGLALAYITNRAIMNRLDDVFGPFGWHNEYKEWKQNSQLCGISIKYEDEWITKWDGADDSATEAVKGGLSDSMKRAAYQWGIGRYLYKLPSQWHKLKPAGKSYVLDGKPSLPAWALPKEKVVFLTESQFKQVTELLTELSTLRAVEESVIKGHLNVNNLAELTSSEANEKIANLKKWIQSAKGEKAS
jgi:hypothetical protein